MPSESNEMEFIQYHQALNSLKEGELIDRKTMLAVLHKKVVKEVDDEEGLKQIPDFASYGDYDPWQRPVDRLAEHLSPTKSVDDIPRPCRFKYVTGEARNSNVCSRFRLLQESYCRNSLIMILEGSS